MKKETIGKLTLGFCFIIIGYFSMIHLLEIIPIIWEVLYEKFKGTNFMIPVLAYVSSSAVVYCFTGVVTLLFLSLIHI